MLTPIREYKGGLVEYGSFFRLDTDGTDILKYSGKGRAFSFLLKHLDESISQSRLERVGKWKQPERVLEGLVRQVNAWCDGYTLEKMERSGKSFYKMFEVPSKDYGTPEQDDQERSRELNKESIVKAKN